jgi:hypothetical protein
MGFQLMSIMTSDDYDVLSHNAYKTEGVSLPLEFDPLAVCPPYCMSKLSSAALQPATRTLAKNISEKELNLEVLKLFENWNSLVLQHEHRFLLNIPYIHNYEIRVFNRLVSNFFETKNLPA